MPENLEDIQHRADALGWKISPHRKGYLIEQGTPEGYPEDRGAYVAADLDEVSQDIDTSYASHIKHGTPFRETITEGKLETSNKPWYQFW